MFFLGISEPLLIGMAVSSVAAIAFYVAFAAGQMNLSQAGFMAIGAYSVAMTSTGGYSIPLGVVIGLLVSALLGGALAALTRKLSGVYLAIATLAFVTVVQQVIYITPALNGPMGIYGIPLALGGVKSWLIVLVVGLVVHRMMKSRIGYEMCILREDPIVARGVGINEIQIRILSGAISAMLASIAGCMLALTTSYISPEEFGFRLLINILSYGVVGGTEHFWGSIIGASLLTLLPEYTRGLQEYRMVLTGAIILGVVVLFPEGIAGGLVRLKEWIRAKQAAGTTRPVATPSEFSAKASEHHIVPEQSFGAAHLAKRFGGVTAVDDVSLDLKGGIVHGLIGPNGAGKSTVVDLLSGEQRSAGGRLMLGSTDVTALPAYRRARLGIVRTFQHSRVTQSISAREVVYSGCLMASRPGSIGFMLGLPASRRLYRQAEENAEAILARLDMGDVAARYVRDLGWEQQRRLEIARAVALKPSVLLLDEPTAGMHAASLPSLGKLLRELARDGTAVLLIEHNVAFMRSTVDTLYAMDSGKMVAQGHPDEVLKTKAVIDSYLGARAA